MAQSITTKGTASSKTSGTSIFDPNVEIAQNRLLLVGCAWENDNSGESPVIDYDGHVLHEIPDSRVQQGDTILAAFATRTRNSVSFNDITATWPSNLTARAFAAVMLEEASFVDAITTNTHTNVTSADTGSAGNSSVANTISVGFFAVLGPGSDNPQPTAGSGHTLQQEASTVGGTAADNITLYQTSEVLTATGAVQASISNMANARDVASLVIAFRVGPTYTVSRAEYVANDGYPGMESIHFIMEDSSNNDLFTIRIPREEFNELSDIEVEDKLLQEAIWWANKEDGAPSPDFKPTSAFDTRVASFVNDAFIT